MINTLPIISGTWTPSLAGNGGGFGQTYANQIGTYVKIGRLVNAFYEIVLTNKGTIIGEPAIINLPFVADSSLFMIDGSVSFTNLSTNWISINMVIVPSSNVGTFRGIQAAGTSNNNTMSTTDLTNTTNLIGTVTYFAAS